MRDLEQESRIAFTGTANLTMTTGKKKTAQATVFNIKSNRVVIQIRLENNLRIKIDFGPVYNLVGHHFNKMAYSHKI